jgi:hypothetical protein
MSGDKIRKKQKIDKMEGATVHPKICLAIYKEYSRFQGEAPDRSPPVDVLPEPRT